MGNVQDLQNALLDATKLLSEKSIDNAKYAYTIKCTIIGIENASLNLYTVEYGANTFNAYANNGVSYKADDIVYVLIPDGDFSQEKQIIGAVAPKASMYVPEEPSDIYVSMTDNLFGIVNQVDLKSWKDTTENVDIDTSNFGMIFNDYLSNGRNFKFTARIKTEIDKDHQVKGNYGLILNLPFLEPSTNGGDAVTAVWRSYIMDVSTIEGNPYDFNTWNKIDLYYNIDEELKYDTSRDPYITAFVSGFGYVEDRTDIEYDIHIKDIGIEMVDVLSEADMQGYYLGVVPSAGSYFLNGKYNASKTLTPVLKVKGKTESNLNKWECYWFVEDTSIGIESDGYLNIGGLGWKCLNRKTNISYDSTGKQNYQYVTNDYSYTVTDADVVSTLRYKCALVQDDVVVSGTIKLKNLNSSIEVSLISATGSNTFVAETGYVDLKARIYYPGVSDRTDSDIIITTAWQRFDKADNYIDNDFYEVIKYNDPVVVTSATGIQKTVLETEIKYPCSKLEQMNTINCTFYSTIVINGSVVKSNLGTASIVVSTSRDFTYGLAIDGGDVLYKYDSDGDSPLVANYDGPLSSRVKTISPITYKVYKADGSELTDTEYLYCNYTWSFPKNSMMKLQGYTNEQLTALPQDDNYYYIIGYGKNNINYTILNSFNKKKNDNTLLLSVVFGGNTLRASVSPKFLKEGESGTNGTKYSAIINYDGYGYGEKDYNGKLRKLQLVYVATKGWYIYDIRNEKLNPFEGAVFAVSVYGDGDRITDNNRYHLSWDMFDNTTSSENKTGINTTCFNVDNYGILFETSDWEDSTDIFTNVVRVTVTITDPSETNSKEVIYAYYPLEITRVAGDDEKYLGKIPTLDGGFDQVVYAADGTNPEYDSSSSFECIDSLYNDTTEYYTYNWEGSTNLRVGTGHEYQNKISPLSKFDNGCSRNYVKVSLSMSDSQIGEINNLINELSINISNTEDLINFYANNKQHLFDFLEKFRYNYYISQLDLCKGLLSLRGEAIQIIDNMYPIIEEINIYCQENNIQISDFNYIAYYNVCRSTLALARKSLYKLLTNYNLGDLSNLTSILLSVPDRVKEKYGVAIYSQLYSLVVGWNEQITYKYQPIYTKLATQIDGKYIYQSDLDILQDVCNEVVELSSDTDLTFLTKAHDNNDPLQEFINLQSQIVVLVDGLDSAEGPATTYSTIVDNILKNVNEVLNIYYNTSYQEQYYEDINNELQNKLIEYQKQKDGYEKALLPNSINYIVHIKPIVMVYNRYELSHLNGWDGNKLYVDEQNDQYMFMPQVGAGAKKNGTFTGVLMGVKKFNSSSTQHIGLFGYSSGIQSFFMNAEDGSTIMGKSGSGQIIADPSQDKALLYSYNFWKPTSYGNDGKPSSYAKSNYNKQGMLIDLSTPEIRFGNGNFVVTEDGNATIAGGGTIAGWKVSDTQIYSNISALNGRITLDSGATVTGVDEDGNKIYEYGAGKLFSHNHNSLNNTTNGFYLAADGLSIGNSIRVSSADGGSILVGRLTGSRHWTINGNGSNSYISYNTNSFNSGSTSVYIGTDGISLGSDRFYVTNSGSLYARDGDIGGWSLGRNSLSANGIEINSNGTIKGGNWEIKSGSATFNNITANGTGQIGGWTIGSHSLTGSGITLGTSGIALSGGGTLTGTGFALGSSGLALTSGSINLGNTTLNSSGLAMSAANTTVGGKGLQPYIEELAVGQITATNIYATGVFNYRGRRAAWEGCNVAQVTDKTRHYSFSAPVTVDTSTGKGSAEISFDIPAFDSKAITFLGFLS